MPPWFARLAVLCAALFAVAPILIALAPAEREMGAVQKIFYFHTPAAWMFLTAGVVCGVASARYLRTGSPRHDRVAWAAAELLVLFGLIALVTGPLWARKSWGTFWTLDPRLTTSLLTGMIFIAYLLLRNLGTTGEAERRFAAGLAVLGGALMPVIHYSVQLWRGQHPTVITAKGGGLHPDMRTALLISFTAFTALTALLIWVRTRAERDQRRVQLLELDAAERGLLEEMG